MYLFELLLPLYDNEKNPFPRTAFDGVRHELTERFGGVTAFMRSPAVGVWKESAGEVNYDDVVIFEVMAEELEREWWTSYGVDLARRFRQEEILIRATLVERL